MCLLSAAAAHSGLMTMSWLSAFLVWAGCFGLAALQKFDLPPVRVGHAWRMLHVQFIISMDAFNKCRWFACLLVCDATFKNVP